MTKNKCSLIHELYQDEAENGRQEYETVQLSIQLTADHKFLLEALAERFNVSQSSIARPLLEDALGFAFSSLSDKDMSTVADYADKKTHDFLVKTYKDRGGNFEHTGMGRWAAFAYCAQVNDQATKEEVA
jgi:hypothetical protein